MWIQILYGPSKWQYMPTKCEFSAEIVLRCKYTSPCIKPRKLKMGLWVFLKCHKMNVSCFDVIQGVFPLILDRQMWFWPCFFQTMILRKCCRHGHFERKFNFLYFSTIFKIIGTRHIQCSNLANLSVMLKSPVISIICSGCILGLLTSSLLSYWLLFRIHKLSANGRVYESRFGLAMH